MKKRQKPAGDPGATTAPIAHATTPPRRTLTRAEAKVGRRAGALFTAASMDSLLREQFVTDPAHMMSDYVFGERLSGEASDAANQLLYSVVSHPRLRDWMVQYSRGLGGSMPSRDAFAHQFARAVAASGDDVTALALIRGAAANEDQFVVQSDLLGALIAVIGGRVGSTGTEMSPGGGTEMSPGGGTEMSPGAFMSGTEMSPGGGTEMSPGGGTEMSPGAFMSGTEMSPGGGTEMSPGGGTEMSPGAFMSGTEMSPGGGTEMSPGGGTEMSPGALGTTRLPGELLITLDALVRYATNLRMRGALASSGLENR